MAGNRVNVDLDLNVQSYVQGMNQATESTKQYETETRKVSDATGNFRKEFAAAKKDAMNLAAAYRNLSAEEKNSQFGKEMALQLEAAKQKASELLDVQSDMQQELRNMASDTATFDSLSQGMNVFMQTTSAALGVVAQFTGNEEDARRAVVMFTTAQSSLNAITQIQNALQKQSALMLGVTKVQSLAATAAENLNTAAKSKNIVVTKLATVAQAAFNKVAMMNPYVLLATAIIAVGTALYGLISWMNDASEAEEREAEQAKKNKEAHEQQRDTILNAAASSIKLASEISTLKEQYLKANDEIARTDILERAAKHFKSLGMECNSLTDTQRILVEDGDKLVKLIDLQGETAAINALKIQHLSIELKKLYDAGMSLTDARAFLDKNDEYLRALKDEEQSLQKQSAELRKQLKIRSDVFKSSNSKGGKNDKNKPDYDKDSLADLENRYNKLLEKLKKKKLSPIDLEKTKAEIEKIKNQIKEEKIRLGLEEPDPKDKQGTIAWYENLIKELEKKKAMLKIDAHEAREQIEKEINGIQLKIKLETEGTTKEGRLGVSEALLGNYKKNIPAIEKAINDLKGRIAQDDDWLKPTVSVQKYYDKIRELEKEIRILKGAQEELASGKSPFDHMMEDTAKAFEGIHAIDSVISSFSNLTDVLEGNGNAWEKFMAILSTVETVLTTINTLQQIYNALTEQAEIRKTAEAMATGGAAAAAEAKAVAEESAIPAAEAAAVANKSLEASVLDLAAAQIFAAHASIPFAGVGLASGFVTTMLGAMTTAKATIKSMQAFAEGGIVRGSSYSGDQTLIRVNAGEMILNSRQQKNLFDLLDSGAMPNANGVNVQVTGVIKGTDIILVQKNTNKVLRKTGNNISF